MNFRKLASVAGLAAALALPAAVAQAQQTWSFQDDDIDFVLDGTTLQPKTSGTIAVGDVFVAVFEIPTFTINGVPSIPGGQELTGIAVVELTSIDGAGVGATYNFSPYSGGLNFFLPGADVTGGEAGGDAVIAMYFNDATGDANLILDPALNPLSNCTSLNDCIQEATLGDLLQVDGFGENSFWEAVQVIEGGNDLATVLGTLNTITVANVTYSLENLSNVGGLVVSPIIGSGDIKGGTDLCPTFPVGCPHLVNGAVGFSDIDATKLVLQVPEPGSLVLLGAGLAGMGLVRRRRKFLD